MESHRAVGSFFAVILYTRSNWRNLPGDFGFLATEVVYSGNRASLRELKLVG